MNAARMRSRLVAAFLMSSLWGIPAQAQGRLFDDLDEAEETPSRQGSPDERDEVASPERVRLPEEPADHASASPAAPVVAPSPALQMKQISAGVSAGAGALVVGLAGAGAAFAHGGLWTLSPSDTSALVTAGFFVFPLVGAAGGAAIGAQPFVDRAGVAWTAGSALLGAGLGSLAGFGVGNALAGPRGAQPWPGENAYAAVTLTATMLGAGLGGGVAAGAAAPFFVVEE